MQQTLWLQTDTDHTETERPVNWALCTFASPELRVPYLAKERFAALFWVPNYPHINIASMQVEGRETNSHAIYS